MTRKRPKRKFTAFFWSFEALSGKFKAISGKFTGHFRCFRESFRRDRESLRLFPVILDVIGKVYDGLRLFFYSRKISNGTYFQASITDLHTTRLKSARRRIAVLHSVNLILITLLHTLLISSTPVQFISSIIAVPLVNLEHAVTVHSHTLFHYRQIGLYRW